MEEFIAIVAPKIVELLALIIVAVITRFAIPAVQAYVGAERLAMLTQLAKEAYAFAEKHAPELKLKGEEKLEMATDYLNARLAERRIPVTVEQVRAAIEAAWLEYNPAR